jgi:sn-glycerol 3-phosphate transport system substrate-binding protein
VKSRCDPASESRVVKLWESLAGNAARDTFASLVASINESHPDVQIVAEHINDNRGMLAHLRDVPPSDWPDVLLAQPQALKQLVDTGRTIPPNECDASTAASDDLLPVVRSTFSTSRGLEAVPYAVSTQVLVYDAAEMRKAGLDPAKPPRTLEDLTRASQQIVRSGASPHGLVVHDWFSNIFMQNGAAQRGENVLLPDNGRGTAPAHASMNTAANTAVLNWVTKLIDEAGGVWIGGVPSGLEDLVRVVDTKDGAAMTIHTSASLGEVIVLLAAGTFPGVELGVGPLPGPSPGALIGGAGLWLIDHGDASRAGAAFRATRNLTEPAAVARLDAATGYLPPSRTVAADPALVQAWLAHPQLRVGFDQIADMPESAATAGALYGPISDVEAIFYQFTSDFVEHRGPPDAALEKLTSRINGILDQYQATIPSK